MHQNKSLFSKLENISAKDIEAGFAKTQHIADTEKEVAQKDIEDAYQLRKFFNQAIQKALLCLPYLSWLILGVCAVCICSILVRATYYLILNEQRLFEIIENAVWISLISLAVFGIKSLTAPSASFKAKE